MALQTPIANETGAASAAAGAEATTLPHDGAGLLAPEPASVQLSGWGRFPEEFCHVYQPAGAGELAGLLRSGRDRTYIARGLGRSYGDASLNRDQAVVSSLKLNRILSFDDASGVLDCEAGVSLDEIIHYALPRGFFLPVTPGTRHITVGGAIAADVHGKNHHQAGSFSNFVIDVELLTAEGDCLKCSRQLYPDVFWATVGGMGLTGFITRAQIQLRRVESAYLRVQVEKAPSLVDALSVLEAGDRHYEYSAAWVDCVSRSARLGRSVIMLGRHAPAAELGEKMASPLTPPERRQWAVPSVLPVTPLRRWTVQAFNAVYFGSRPARSEQWTGFDSFFYPLDSIQNWNRLYGKKGFVQYQAVAPHEAAASLFTGLLERIHESGRAPFLGVLKRFGPGSAGMLSFPMAGATLALDLPFDRELPGFLQVLDTMVADDGGRTYLAKDAVLSPESFARMHSRLDEFRQVKARLDPRGRISSSLARRLKIVDA